MKQFSRESVFNGHAIAAVGRKEDAVAAEIKIGVVLPLSGVLSGYGQIPSQKGWISSSISLRRR